MTIAAGLLLPAGPEELLTVPDSQIGQPFGDVAVAEDGTRVVTWEAQRLIGPGATSSINYVVFYPDGTRTSVLKADPPQETLFALNPVAGIDGSGDFVIAWETGTSETVRDIVFRRFNRDSTPEGPVTGVVAFQPEKDQHSPEIAVFPNGDFLLVWEHAFSVSDSDVRGAVFWTNPSTMDFEAFKADFAIAATSLAESQPTAAVVAGSAFGTGSTSAVVAFRHKTFSPAEKDTILAQRLDSGGTLLASPFRVNANDTAGPQRTAPSAAMDAFGAFVVAWEEGFGAVVSRRFTPIGATLDAGDVPVAAFESLGFLTSPEATMDALGRYNVSYRLVGAAFFDEFAAGVQVKSFNKLQTFTEFAHVGTRSTMSRNGRYLASFGFCSFGGSSFRIASGLHVRLEGTIDSDGDGVSDTFELFLGSDPSDPASLPAVLDLNLDGEVNSGDAIHWYRHLTGSSPVIPAP